ncbi:uncharacterized protein JCM6883_002611 [Sporobolomyces salmoneus]|uniref:uncharacterized protein n=1 Tax=Sporobolomyces salmoneus TaxID=183962 RepID=UPI00317BE982
MFIARQTLQTSRRALSTSTRVSQAVPNTSGGNPSPHSAPFPGQKDPRDFNPKDTAWKQRKSAFLGISPVYAAFGTIGILATGAFINYSMKDNSLERPRNGVPASKELKDALQK